MLSDHTLTSTESGALWAACQISQRTRLVATKEAISDIEQNEILDLGLPMGL